MSTNREFHPDHPDETYPAGWFSEVAGIFDLMDEMGAVPIPEPNRAVTIALAASDLDAVGLTLDEAWFAAALYASEPRAGGSLDWPWVRALMQRGTLAAWCIGRAGQA